MLFLGVDADGFEREIVDDQRNQEGEQVHPVATTQKGADADQQSPQTVVYQDHGRKRFYKEFTGTSRNPNHSAPQSSPLYRQNLSVIF